MSRGNEVSTSKVTTSESVEAEKSLSVTIFSFQGLLNRLDRMTDDDCTNIQK